MLLLPLFFPPIWVVHCAVLSIFFLFDGEDLSFILCWYEDLKGVALDLLRKCNSHPIRVSIMNLSSNAPSRFRNNTHHAYDFLIDQSPSSLSCSLTSQPNDCPPEVERGLLDDWSRAAMAPSTHPIFPTKMWKGHFQHLLYQASANPSMPSWMSPQSAGSKHFHKVRKCTTLGFCSATHLQVLGQ